MGCCGQKRAALTSVPATTVRRLNPNLPTASPQPSIAPQQSAVHVDAAQASPAYSPVALRYTETSPILVKGPASGRQYQFSGLNPVQPVDARDVAGLLRTRFFRQS